MVSFDMRFDVRFKMIEKKIPVQFNKTKQVFSTDFRGLQVVTVRPDVEYYEGEYKVTPTVDGQTLETKEKFMIEDLQIKAIPFFDVSNTAGGSTVYIGSEVII